MPPSITQQTGRRTNTGVVLLRVKATGVGCQPVPVAFGKASALRGAVRQHAASLRLHNSTKFCRSGRSPIGFMSESA